MSRLGIVIFGATGYTGTYAVLDMARLAAARPGLTWAVAGRSRARLQALMADVTAKTGQDHSHIPIITAEVTDEKSLKDMCAQAMVVVNCCGPYRLYGEPVLRAAVEQGAHHVDISGEPQFMETMQLKYSEKARAAGVYAISACGFDSIPNDMGVIYLQQQFGGTVNSVESYMKSSVPPELRGEAKRGIINVGTWESLILGLTHWDELKPLRQKLYPEKLPPFKPRMQKRGALHKNPRGGWCVPFMGADVSVVYRSQRALYQGSGQRPAQFSVYLDLGSWLLALFAIVAAGTLYLCTRFSFLRNFLLNHPRICSLGMVGHGPTDSVVRQTRYSVVLHGEGWDHGTDTSQGLNKRLSVKVSGLNPGYGATVSALLHCAVTILEEQDRMPSTGGVLSTGYAFKDTTLIERLSQPGNNMKFEVLSTTT